MNDIEELNKFLSVQDNRIKNNVEIISKNDLRFPFLLHIDHIVPKEFIPLIPKRAAPLEDKTVARIAVTDTLIGCMLAYGNIYYDYQILKLTDFKISKLNFEHAVKPNVKLVYDSKETNEHWLIPYNKKHSSFKPVEIGIFFFRNLKFKEIGTENNPIIIVTFMSIYCKIDQELSFSSKRILKPGFYEITFESESMYSNNYTYKNDHNFTIKTISKLSFDKEKRISATALDSSAKTVPLYEQW